MSICLHTVATIARYTALEALRTRYIWLLAGLFAAGLGIGAFSGELAITETRQTQAAIVASLLRIVSVVLVILFVTTSVSRDFSDKSVELMLSLPLPRAGYYLGKFAGYALVAVSTAFPLLVLMLFYAPASAVIGWGLSLMFELLLVCAISLMFAFAFSQLTASIAASLLFYFLGRSIAAIQLMAHGPLVNPEHGSQMVMTAMVDAMAYLLPDLERFTRSDWLVYPASGVMEMSALVIQTLVYLTLLSAVALFDLYRKNF